MLIWVIEVIKYLQRGFEKKHAVTKETSHSNTVLSVTIKLHLQPEEKGLHSLKAYEDLPTARE